jgi:hypothetical protein
VVSHKRLGAMLALIGEQQKQLPKDKRSVNALLVATLPQQASPNRKTVQHEGFAG